MIALLLNPGLGSRMGDETREHPKCMTEIAPGETIISWHDIPLYPLDVQGLLCAEIDNQADKEDVSRRFAKEVLA